MIFSFFETIAIELCTHGIIGPSSKLLCFNYKSLKSIPVQILCYDNARVTRESQSQESVECNSA